MWKRIQFLALLAAMLFLCHCGEDEIPSKLGGIETDYFNEYYRFYPTRAAEFGLQQFDGRLDDVSSLPLGRRMDSLARLLIRLQNLRSGELSPDDQLTGAVLDAAIRSELTDLAHIGVWRRNPMYYVDIPMRAIDRLMRRTHTTPSSRLRSIVISVNEIEAVLAAMRANLSDTPQPFAIAGKEACQRLLVLLETDLPPWGVNAAGVDMRLARNIDGGIFLGVDSVEETLQWLDDELLPAANGRVSLGPEQFIMKLLFDSMVEMRLSELLRMAEDGFERTSKEFEQTAARMAPGKTPARLLRERAASAIPEAELLGVAGREVPRVYEFIRSKSLLDLPKELSTEPSTRKYRFQLLPQFLRSPLAPYAADLPPREGNDALAEESGVRALPRDGYFLVGPPAPGWSAALKSEYIESLTLEGLRLGVAHNLVPGRYTQALRMRDNPVRVARALASRVTLDGWAHYSEQLLIESGFEGGDQSLRLSQLHRALVRHCRFLTSLRIHTMGMTVDEATRLFREKAYLGPEMAAAEARRVSYDPLSLAEALGKELILRLRDDYRARKGPEYTPGAFHNEFLSHGGLPIPLIRKAMLGQGPEAVD